MGRLPCIAVCWPRVAVCVLVVVAVLGIRCTTDDIAGPPAQTKTVMVEGVVLDPNWSAASDVRVFLVPTDHNPIQGSPLPDSLADTTGPTGNFRFFGVEAGTYNIEARHGSNGMRGFLPGIAATTDTVTVPSLRLSAPGAGVLVLPDSLRTTTGSVHIEGSLLSNVVGQDDLLAGYVVFDSLPAALLPRVWFVKSSGESLVLLDSLRTTASDTVLGRWPRVVVVDTTGDDANDGITAPVRTIARACSLLSAGDTLLINPGRYVADGVGMRQPLRNGAPSAPIVIRGASTGTAEIAGGTSSDSNYAVWSGIRLVGASHVRVEDLTFAGLLIGVHLQDGSDVEISRCEFRDNASAGVRGVDCQRLAVTGCSFIDSSTTRSDIQDYGVLLDSSELVIVDDCRFFGSHQEGCVVVGSNGNDITIRRSLFEGARRTALLLGSDTGSVSPCVNVSVESCIFRGAENRPTGAAVQIANAIDVVCEGNYFEGEASDSGETLSGVELMQWAGGTPQIRKNYFAFFPIHAAMTLEGSGAGSVGVYNNTFYQCVNDIVTSGPGNGVYRNNLSVNCGGTDLGASNFRGNPLFVGPLSRQILSSGPHTTPIGPYHALVIEPFELQNASPVIDSGVDVGLPYAGNAPDIGAYEKR